MSELLRDDKDIRSGPGASKSPKLPDYYADVSLPEYLANGLAKWTLAEGQIYLSMFRSADGRNGPMKVDAALRVLREMRLPAKALDQLCELVNIRVGDEVGKTQFVMAVHLAHLYEKSSIANIPVEVPAWLYEEASRLRIERSETPERPEDVGHTVGNIRRAIETLKYIKPASEAHTQGRSSSKIIRKPLPTAMAEQPHGGTPSAPQPDYKQNLSVDNDVNASSSLEQEDFRHSKRSEWKPPIPPRPKKNNRSLHSSNAAIDSTTGRTGAHSPVVVPDSANTILDLRTISKNDDQVQNLESHGAAPTSKDPVLQELPASTQLLIKGKERADHPNDASPTPLVTLGSRPTPCSDAEASRSEIETQITDQASVIQGTASEDKYEELYDAPDRRSDSNSNRTPTPSSATSGKSMIRPKSLGDYFAARSDKDVTQDRFSDADCRAISRLLVQSGRQSWSSVPRLYIILRIINQLQVLDSFVDQGMNDLWLPFTLSTLPNTLNLSLRNEFLKVQDLVRTIAIHMENGAKEHVNFDRNDTFPYEKRGRLGMGGSAVVDKILSPLSGREFARKRFRRMTGVAAQDTRTFFNELKVLRRINHIHCVELIASYTDPRYFGIVMTPAADCNLATFYQLDDAENMNLMRTFYGCLTTALNYLHTSSIRHRDIKPENVLIKARNVYLADFGISLDWQEYTRATTTADSAKSLIYCAPEVAQNGPRNQSSDIWSLGCLFLEMLTVIKGRTVDDLRSFFRSKTGSNRFYQNIRAVRCWLDELRRIETDCASDDVVPDWIEAMVREPRTERIVTQTLQTMVASFRDSGNRGSPVNPFCGECCRADDPSSDDGCSDGDPLAETQTWKTARIETATMEEKDY